MSGSRCADCVPPLRFAPDSLPTWLDNEAYLTKIRHRLAGFTYAAIASALGVCVPYAASIRSGRRIPHPRHWETLTRLASIVPAYRKKESKQLLGTQADILERLTRRGAITLNGHI